MSSLEPIWTPSTDGEKHSACLCGNSEPLLTQQGWSAGCCSRGAGASAQRGGCPAALEPSSPRGQSRLLWLQVCGRLSAGKIATERKTFPTSGTVETGAGWWGCSGAPRGSRQRSPYPAVGTARGPNPHLLSVNSLLLKAGALSQGMPTIPRQSVRLQS